MRKIIFRAKILFIPCRENDYKPKFLDGQVLFYYILVLLFLKLIAVSFIFCFPKTIFFADLTKSALIQLTNQERQILGLPVLKENPKLTEAAYQKAQDMLQYDYFSHYSPTGISPWYWFKKVGYDYQLAGENLAIGFLDSQEVVEAWKNSPSHRENLLNPNFREIGLAVLKGDFQGAETTVVVQLFGSPKKEVKTGQEEIKERVEKKVTEKPEVEKPEVTPPVEEKKNLPEEPLIAGVEESEFHFTTFKEKGEPDFKFNFFKFMMISYPDILQNIIFYSLLFVTIALILNVFINFHIQDKKLILKTVFFIIILVLFVLTNKELIIQLIPHNLLI